MNPKAYTASGGSRRVLGQLAGESQLRTLINETLAER